MAACITEQFKLASNAQKGKIFKSNVTTIKIKCSNNFPRRYTVKITYTSLGIMRKFHHYVPLKRLFPSAKITLLISHSDWSNLVTHQVINESNLQLRKDNNPN